MKHARDDYNRIQDPSNKIPDDEPVFLIRGQDIAAPLTLEYWANVNELVNGDPELSKRARDHAKLMLKWQNDIKNKPADL